jgi:hypothetical protein
VKFVHFTEEITGTKDTSENMGLSSHEDGFNGLETKHNILAQNTKLF